MLIVIRIISIPGADVDIEGVEFGRKIGIFLGLIAAGGITFGGYTAMNERPAGQHRQRRPAGPPPSGPGPGCGSGQLDRAARGPQPRRLQSAATRSSTTARPSSGERMVSTQGVLRCSPRSKARNGQHSDSAAHQAPRR